MNFGAARSTRSLILCSLVGGGILVAGCAGRGNGVSILHGEYGYLATGTNIVQFGVNQTTGQLRELIPNTAPSVNAVAVTATSDGKFAYAANFTPGNISQYSINTDGTLSPLSPSTVSCGASPDAIVASPNGKFVFVLNSGDNTIGEFAVDAAGALSPLSPSTVPVAADGNALVISASGKYLYATSGSTGKLSAYAIGSAGQLTPLTVPTYDLTAPHGAAVSPNGLYLYVAVDGGVAQYTINGDGSLVALSPASVSAPGTGNDAVALSPNGAFAYVSAADTGTANSPVGQFSVGGDGTLAALNPAQVDAGLGSSGVVVDPSGKYVYVTNRVDGTVSEYLMNADGTLAAQSPAVYNTNGAIQMIFVNK